MLDKSVAPVCHLQCKNDRCVVGFHVGAIWILRWTIFLKHEFVVVSMLWNIYLCMLDRVHQWCFIIHPSNLVASFFISLWRTSGWRTPLRARVNDVGLFHGGDNNMYVSLSCTYHTEHLAIFFERHVAVNSNLVRNLQTRCNCPSTYFSRKTIFLLSITSVEH